MKQVYYYYVYCIYQYYKKQKKESDFEALISTTLVSTLFLFLNITTVYTALTYFSIMPNNSNVLIPILIMLVLGVGSYCYVLREKRFMKCKFIRSKKKQYWIIIYMIVSVVMGLAIGSMNRKKVYSERPPYTDSASQESLESQIRDWIRNL